MRAIRRRRHLARRYCSVSGDRIRLIGIRRPPAAMRPGPAGGDVTSAFQKPLQPSRATGDIAAHRRQSHRAGDRGRRSDAARGGTAGWPSGAIEFAAPERRDRGPGFGRAEVAGLGAGHGGAARCRRSAGAPRVRRLPAPPIRAGKVRRGQCARRTCRPTRPPPASAAHGRSAVPPPAGNRLPPAPPAPPDTVVQPAIDLRRRRQVAPRAAAAPARSRRVEFDQGV